MSRPQETPDLDKECFFIAPIGEAGSEIRRRSDGVLKFVVCPAAEELGLTALRADELADPGQITLQIVQHVLGARAAVADLTGANPNVYYELAIRHTARLPTVLIAQDGERLPFDIAQMRTIFFDHTDLSSAAECRDRITTMLRNALDGVIDSPIETAAAVGRLEKGSAVERTLAEVLTSVQDLVRETQRLGESDRWTRIPADPRALADVVSVWQSLEKIARESADARLSVLAESLSHPVRHLERYLPNDFVMSDWDANLTEAQRDLERAMADADGSDAPATPRSSPVRAPS